MIGAVVRGGLAGAAATWVMDQVTTTMLAAQPPDVTAQEAAARPHGRGAIENLVDRLDTRLGLTLDEGGKARLAQAVHYGLGIGPGALYALLRRHVPLLGAGGGLAYGFLLWAVNDEYLNTQLGLAGPPEAYPAETHWRGLVGHLVLGSVTNSAVEALGG